jgi:hypothetical protein
LFSDSLDALPKLAIEIQEMGYEPVLWTETDVLETFKAFSACSLGAICSNSTFAWWAAYFAQERIDALDSYKAYFPTPWFPSQKTPAILDLPFTEAVPLASLPAVPILKAFSYS